MRVDRHAHPGHLSDAVRQRAQTGAAQDGVARAGDQQQPARRDQVVAGLVAHRRIDLLLTGLAAVVSAHDVVAVERRAIAAGRAVGAIRVTVI